MKVQVEVTYEHEVDAETVGEAKETVRRQVEKNDLRALENYNVELTAEE